MYLCLKEKKGSNHMKNKRNIGKKLAVYPTPVLLVGTKINDKVNWVTIAHIGITGMNETLISVAKGHYSNRGIKVGGYISLNLTTESMIEVTDYIGLNSGHNVDKSKVLDYYTENYNSAPIVTDSPVSMEARVIDIYETETEYNYILQIENTYAKDEVLNNNGSIDFSKVKPLLFEMQGPSYMVAEKNIGVAWDIGKKYENERLSK